MTGQDWSGAALVGSPTEAVNPATADIDQRRPEEIVALLLAEEARVAAMVADEGERIARLAEVCAARLRSGGRLVYVGAGTSGRLGALDAAELPPTFGIDSAQVVALVAGGHAALTGAVEAAEDRAGEGVQAVSDLEVGASDVVLGIAASGRTPFVLGAVREARRRGAFTAGLACARPSPLAELVEIAIEPVVGPEAIAGSTRLKAGTATKLTLNALSTATMVLLGKTFGNLMVDMRPTNEKLRRRALAMLIQAGGVLPEDAAGVLAAAGGDLKTAIVMARRGVDVDEARARLEAAGGLVRHAVGLER